ncbi:MAG: glycosyltransferase family 39 protein [Acetobacteraceae bacterium]|nr:glycosyltransferase family 39 protein [Acetobacteraceae bacterium]
MSSLEWRAFSRRGVMAPVIAGPRSASTATLALILGTAVIRLIFADAMGLGVDESYMVAAGRVLSLGYYDHPPAAWWLSWAAAHLAGSETPVVVRFPFIMLFGLSTWLMFRLGALAFGERAGLWAAVLLNLSPVFGITTGSWVLPDGPLDCALLGAALCLMHALPVHGRGARAWWSGAGLCAGLALFSKYSAVLTLLGMLLFLLSSREHRRWLRQPEPYLAALLALLAFSPAIAWNAMHGWVSFAFQGERAAGVHFHPLGPLVTLAGEALFVLPWIWAPMMVVFIIALRRGPAAWQTWLLCCLAAPPIILFALISVWSSQRVLFHWAAPGYLLLFPLLGDAVAQRARWPVVRGMVAATAAFAVAGVAVIGVQERYDLLSPAISAVTRKDPTIEGIDWRSLRSDLEARGLLHAGTVVGVPNWRDAGKIAYALGSGVPVICLNKDSRQFGIALPAGRYVGEDVLLVSGSELVAPTLRQRFDSIEALAPSAVIHAGRTLRQLGVYVGHHLRSDF